MFLRASNIDVSFGYRKRETAKMGNLGPRSCRQYTASKWREENGSQ
jgi:hypothetical protein